MFQAIIHSTKRFFAKPMTRLVTPGKEISKATLLHKNRTNLANKVSVRLETQAGDRRRLLPQAGIICLGVTATIQRSAQGT